MTKLYFTFFGSLFFAALGFFKVTAQQVFKTTPTSVIAYLEYLPPNYDANSDKYPIVFFLHGIGERGPNSTDPAVLSGSIQNVAKHGPPKLVKAGHQFPFILMSPQLKNNYGQWTSAYIMEVINHCKTYLRIDEKRIYLTGLSLGGGGTWVAAQDHPELFAAIAPVCGGYNSPSKGCNLAKENLPVWAFHGDKDTTVPLLRSENMVNAINACVPTPSPLAKLSIYSGVAHNAWDYAYRNDHTLHDSNVYEWLLTYTNTENKVNKIPVADAGGDKEVGLSSATIYGHGTDPDGSVISYSWTKLSGPSATMSNRGSATLSLSSLSPGEYIFKFTVTDDRGNTDSDYVKIIADSTNQFPVANAGPNKIVSLPVNSVTITGAGSDTDGTITSYKWSKVSGPSVRMTNTTSATFTASGLTAGSYIFRLTVTDNDGATDTDDMLVKVAAAIGPVVSAGPDKLVKLPTKSAALTGSATDRDGTIVSYRWTKISGGSCTMNNVTSSILRLNYLVSGVYTFRLTATDNDGNTGSDDVVVTVDNPPIVDAGADILITLPMEEPLYLTGSATDSDGTIIKYVWSKYSGPSASVENTTSPTLKINKLYKGTYVFKLAVTDNLGVAGVDYVTITVSDVLTASSVNAAEGGNMYFEGSMQPEERVLGNFAPADIRDCEVIIFNSNGEQIYNGNWSIEKDRTLLREGLYIYNIIRGGKRLHSGKICKKST